MVKKLYTQKQVIKFVKEYASHIKKKHNITISRVFLFGSYAKSEQRNYSDVDVCIISPSFKKKNPTTFLWKNLREEDIDHLIEPIGFHPSDFIDENPVAWEIKKHGKEIKIK